VDSLLSATDLTEAASGDLDFDFDESAPDTDFTEAASGDLDFDFDESALDTDFTDAVSGDLDFDFSEEAAAESDNELFSEAAINDFEGDFENGAGESDALAEPDLASDAADFDDLDALLEHPTPTILPVSMKRSFQSRTLSLMSLMSWIACSMMNRRLTEPPWRQMRGGLILMS